MTIGYLGYGRMGKAIEALALAAGHTTGLRIDQDNLGDRTADRLRSCDVIMEFTQPESAFENIEACLKAGVPVVSGTTGWLDRMPDVLAICAEEGGALFHASNFSIGVNLFFALNRYLARLIRDLPQYRPTLTETHHIHKRDAPSGTAISLVEGLLRELSRYEGWSDEKEPPDTHIPVRSIREGEVPGTHVVRFEGDVDEIRLEHRAYSREGFAEGALRAAEWIIGKQGYFDMADLLGWRETDSL